MERNSLSKRKDILRWARQRAEDQSAVFNLTVDDITIPDICPALGIPIRFGKSVACDNSPTLDRIVPDLGYVKGNVVVISNRANRLKSNAIWSEMRRMTDYFETVIKSGWMQHCKEDS